MAAPRERLDAGGKPLPDPGPRCAACGRPFLRTAPVGISTTVVIREDHGGFDVKGQPLLVQVGAPGNVEVCPPCAEALGK